MTDERLIRYKLTKIEARIAWLTAELRRAEGKRDGLLRELQDFEGCHDQRFAAVK